MELKDVIAWVDARKKLLGLSDTQAEKQARCPSLVQNMRKTLRNGHGSHPKVASLRRLADVLGEPPAGLFDPLAPLNKTSARNDNPLSAIERLRAEHELYRRKEEEYRRKAEAIEMALEVLERKAG